MKIEDAAAAPAAVPNRSILAGLAARFRRLLPVASGDFLDASIYAFVLRYSLREQIYLVVATVISLPFLYYSLDLPKVIVNGAIRGKDFPVNFLGFQLGQIPYLLVLCGLFLALVLINGWFKYHINVRKGRVGERMLRRLRYSLYERMLRFPLNHFDRTATGEIVAMVTAELEPVGGFIGDAFALPISQLGTLLTILLFMFIQNPLLGLAAIALYPVQGYVIPKKQRKIRQIGRERIRSIRALSDRIGETVAGQIDIRANNGWPSQLADISNRLGEVYYLRFEIYNRKFAVKFLNNLLGQLTPFFFYAIGGYFVISGRLSFGALVAVLAAYKDLSSPWKELLDFYQNQQDVAIKYEQVVEQFQVADMLDPRLLVDEGKESTPLQGDVAFANVALVDSDGIHRLDGISFDFPIGQDVAIIGQSNSGRNILPQMFARLSEPTSGRITIGGTDLSTLPLPVSGRRIGYVGPTTHLFSATVRDNLLLGLRHHPIQEDAATLSPERSRAIAEARASGNTDFDVGADWIDYEQAGVGNTEELEARIIEILRLVDFDKDVYQLGLRGYVDPEARPEVAERLLEARRRLDTRLNETGMSRMVERFDPERYNTNSSVAGNLLFGTPIGPTFGPNGLPGNEYVQSVLDKVGLTQDLLDAGRQVAEMMVELFGDLPPDHEFFVEFSDLDADDLPALEKIVGRMGKGGTDTLLPEERGRLLSLALRLVAARDRLGVLDEGLQQRILQARQAFAEGLPEDLKGAVEFFDPDRYNAAARIEENILFGTILLGEAGSREGVQAAIGEVLDELDMRDMVSSVGLDYAVGTGGSRLSPGQRQKVAIARAVLKRPDLLALNEATAVLDPAGESGLLKALRQEFEGRSIVASLSRPGLAREFDRVLVMEDGKLVKEGPYKELDLRDGPLATLMAAE